MAVQRMPMPKPVRKPGTGSKKPPGAASAKPLRVQIRQATSIAQAQGFATAAGRKGLAKKIGGYDTVAAYRATTNRPGGNTGGFGRGPKKPVGNVSSTKVPDVSGGGLNPRPGPISPWQPVSPTNKRVPPPDKYPW